MAWWSASKRLSGSLLALAGTAALSALMVPERTHLSLATPALVLVVPVVIGVSVGGIMAGAVAVCAGFIAYDLFFIPPFGTLSVGTAQNWVALVVYVVVMLVVARVVVFLRRARIDSRRHEDATSRLYVLSDLLIGEKSATELLQLIVTTIHQAFRPRWAAVLVPFEGGLEVAATAGDPLSTAELASLTPIPGRTESLRTTDGSETVLRLALSARERPVGMVALAGAPLESHGRNLLGTYANHAALALERNQLREQAMRTELLEEVGRLRDALMGAVSHDLRTPLASVKTAVTTLRRTDDSLSDSDRRELLELIETQSDALDRLVDNLLDMTRLQAGALQLRREICPVIDVVEGALRTSAVSAGTVHIDLDPNLPPVDIDQVLMERVIANLLENAARHSPDGESVRVTGTHLGHVVRLAVSDLGPGVPRAERERVFQMFNRVGGGGRAGLGLAIAKAFVEAHEGSIEVDDVPGGGASFAFSMPTATLPPDLV